jgi:hypothetical protein
MASREMVHGDSRPVAQVEPVGEDRLLAHYMDTGALYDPARRKRAYTGVATALGGLIERRAEDQSSMRMEEFANAH